MQVDARAYIFQLFIDIVCFYMFYSWVDTQRISLKKRLLEVACIPIIFLLNIYLNFSVYLIYIVLLYVIRYQFKLNTKAINLLLFSGLCLFLASFVSEAICNVFMSVGKNKGWLFVLSVQAIQIVVLIIIGKTLKKFVNKLFNQKDFSGFLIILQLSLIFIFYFFIQLAIKTNIYDEFAIGTLFFAITEFLILSGLFLLSYFRTQRRYRDNIEQQQLDNLKEYTEQLEQSQLELRKFRHDYKNMLLSLAELSHEGDLIAVNQYLDELQEYSNHELSKLTDYYQDIGNVQEDHLKSVLLSKLFAIKHKNINCHFECRVPVKTIAINPFDMVRLMSITVDNAIEATQGVPEGKITVMLYQAAHNLNITIENTDRSQTASLGDLNKPGVTTKENHSGLGLSIVDDLRRKYTNIFIAQKHERDMFSVQIVIEDHTGGK